MLNFVAHCIAIFIVYWKHLLALLALVVIALFFLYTPVEKTFRGGEQELYPRENSENQDFLPLPGNQSGQRYASLEELKSAERAKGFLPIGYFGDTWPARVVEVLTDEDNIEFVRQDGVKHRYQGFDGYRMKVIRLVTAAKEENLIVFRSERKQ